MKKYQILAPAGNVDALYCAVNNGADAVYLGLDSFNARMKADNFCLDNIAQYIDYCHVFGVKVYVAINTSIKQTEFDRACQMVLDVYDKHADGVIVTDLALMQFSAKNCPLPFEIVASTQLNIHDIDGANYVKKLGATTVVLARETDQQTVANIAKVCDIKIECFIHGALCVCQSGQCLFSSIVGGNSGNRGLCAQPCRQFYSAYDKQGQQIKQGYLLSPKDWCGADVAKQMYNSGVSVYKIEGRNRRSQYSGVASKFYSQLFKNNFEYDSEQLDQLKSMYNRGEYLTQGYFCGKNDGIIYPTVQGHIGICVGKYDKGKLYANRVVNKGDAFKIFHNGVECGSAMALENGKVVRLSVNGKVSNGDSVNITTDTALLQQADCALRKIDVQLEVYANIGQQLRIIATCDNGVVAEYVADFVCEMAQKEPTSAQEIIHQLSKSGETYYTITNIVLYNDAVFLPKSVLNAARRAVLGKLTENIIAQYNKQFLSRKTVWKDNLTKQAKMLLNKSKNGLAVTCSNLQQFACCMADEQISVVVVKTENLNSHTVSRYDNLANKVWYYDAPSFADSQYVLSCAKACKYMGVVAHNVGIIEACQQAKIPYFCGSGLNIYNKQIAQLLTDNFKYPFVYSHELTLNEINQIDCDGYVFVDGQIVLMRLVHCPYKVCYNTNCSQCKFDGIEYIDNKGNNFVIARRRADRCYFELIYGIKLSVVGKINKPSNFMIDYDKDVVSYYKQINNGERIVNIPIVGKYTKGRLFDKVN